MRRRLLRSWLWKPSVQEEVDEELAFHLEMLTREYLASGLTPDEARRAARQRFGDPSRTADACQRLGKERDRDMRRHEYLAELRQDLAFGGRQLRRAPGFAAVAILTLALGIGATTAIFSALYAVALRPLPLPEPDRLVTLAETWRGACCASVSVPNFVSWHERTRDLFTGLAAYHTDSFNLADGAVPERVSGLRASGDFFAVMATPPLVGRAFTAADDVPGRERVVVLGYRLWMRRFGGDPALVGRAIRINGQPYHVLGVMPSSFALSADGEDLWVPAAYTDRQRREFDRHYLDLVARLRPGVTVRQAHERALAVGAQIVREHPDENDTRGGSVRPFMEQFVGDASASYWLLLGAVALVLLIACANVANLLVARGAVRTHEIALRAALGAGRARIVRQLLTESLLLAALGGGAGLLLARAGIDALIAWSPPGTPRLDQAHLDPVTLAFTLIISVLSALLFGLVPAWRAARPAAVETLKTGRSGSLGARHDRLRASLVSAEVALVLVLLAGAALLLRSAIVLQRVDPGFSPHGVLAGRVALPPDDYRDPAIVRGSFERMVDEVRALPGVTEAAVVSRLPLASEAMSAGLVPEGWKVDWQHVAVGDTIETHIRLVTPRYFATLHVPLRRGRVFTDDDRDGAQKVMIVNEAFAARAWPNEDPIGKRVACCEEGPGGPGTPDWKVVVGVVANVKWRALGMQPTPEFYLPIAQVPAQAWDWVQRTMFVAARTDGDPATLATPMRRAVTRVDATLPLFDVGTMDERLAASLATARFNTALLLTLGLAGLVLALVGIYGVIAYFVSHRTQEIGVRLALGASPGDVMRLVVRQGVRPVIWGVGAGLVLALLATRLLASQLFGVTPRDPETLAGVAIGLLVIALVASWLPARRATRIDPTRALQSS